MIRPVILCGGAGTRLWPLSRQNFPKQLLAISGDHSLLQQTAKRVSGDSFRPAIIVSGEEQRFSIQQQLEQIGTAVAAILLEPMGRNTASAAALAAAWLSGQGKDELLLLIPSDHVIGDRDAFLSAIDIGAPHAEQGAIVTFGAKPDEPNTQYGYIEADEGRAIGDGSFAIARFVEKPDAATAAQFLQTGRFFWNSGIFLAKASTLLEEMRRFLPSSLAAISRAIADASANGVLVRPDADAFSQAENISIDHGIMEKTARGMVVPVQMDWSDVGSWDAVWKLGAKDAAGNVIQGNVVTIGTTESLVRNEGGLLVATVGLDKMAVVAVPDAVLIAPLDRVSEVKEIVAALQRHDRDYLASPAKSLHPWGSCETVQFALGPTVRRIVVAPGKAMQVHNQLPSNWTVTSGTAELAVGDEITILRKGHSIQLPGGERRSVANRGDSPLELVEVELRS